MTENEELLQLRKEKALLTYCRGISDLVSPSDVAALIEAEVQIDSQGNINVASAQAAIERLKATRPYMLRSGRADHGLGSVGVPVQIPSDETKARAIFGKGSDGGKSNTLAKTDKPEWKRLRIKAVSLGLVGA
jgi:hypothetical protein